MRILDLLWKNPLKLGLRMLFHNTSPLGNQEQPGVFSYFSPLARGAKSRAICVAEWAIDFIIPCKLACEGIWKHSASLACASKALRFSTLCFISVYPSHLTRSFPCPRPSVQPSVALSRTCPRARLWLRIVYLSRSCLQK